LPVLTIALLLFWVVMAYRAFERGELLLAGVFAFGGVVLSVYRYRAFRAATNRTDQTVVDLREVSFTQTDVTKSSVNSLSLGPSDWIETTPINASVPEKQRPRGLPPLDATEDQIYRIADCGSRLRESIRRSDQLSGDGVYCPICHMANTQLSLLRKPCPRCGRELLLFDWT
jgi:hypothetical protein